MADRWFLRSSGEVEGPYNAVQLRQLVANGTITAESSLRNGDDGRWLRADHVQGLIKPTSAASPPSALPVAKALAAAKPALLRAKPAALTPASIPKPAPAKVRAVDATASAAPRAAAVIPSSNAPATIVDGRHHRRQSSALPLVVGIVVVGGLILGGGAATIIAFVAIPAVVDSSAPHVAPTVADTSTVSAPAQVDEVESTHESLPPSADTRAAAIAGVKSWKPVITQQGAKGGVKSSKMQVKFDKAWLGGDAQRDVGGPELVDPQRQPKFLFVRMVITNVQADQPLEYPGWNNSGSETEAILVDEAGDFAELVPLTDMSTDRLSDVSIAPKANATDVLVFAMTNPDFTQFRLALPFSGMGHCGFQIERAMLAEPGTPTETSEVAAPTSNNDPLLGNLPNEDEPPIEDESVPPDTSVPTPEETAENPPAEDLPDDLDDLQRSIAEEAGASAEPAVDDKP